MGCQGCTIVKTMSNLILWDIFIGKVFINIELSHLIHNDVIMIFIFQSFKNLFDYKKVPRNLLLPLK